MFENEGDGRLLYAGGNARSLWPGPCKPGLWHSALSRMALMLRHGLTDGSGQPLVPLPPVFERCTQVCGPGVVGWGGWWRGMGWRAGGGGAGGAWRHSCGCCTHIHTRTCSMTPAPRHARPPTLPALHFTTIHPIPARFFLINHESATPPRHRCVPAPPPLQVLTEADQLAARDAYWRAVCDHTEPHQHDEAARLLRAAVDHNPHIAGGAPPRVVGQ